MIQYVLISIREMTATINTKFMKSKPIEILDDIGCRLATWMNQQFPIVQRICHVLLIMSSCRPRDMGRIQRLTSVCMDAPTLPTDTVRGTGNLGTTFLISWCLTSCGSSRHGSGLQAAAIGVQRPSGLDVWHSLNAWCQRSTWSVQELFLLNFMKVYEILHSLLYTHRQWSEDVSTRFTLLQCANLMCPIWPIHTIWKATMYWFYLILDSKKCAKNRKYDPNHQANLWHPRYGKTMMLICCLSGPKRQARRKVWCLIHQVLMHWSLKSKYLPKMFPSGADGAGWRVTSLDEGSRYTRLHYINTPILRY